VYNSAIVRKLRVIVAVLAFVLIVATQFRPTDLHSSNPIRSLRKSLLSKDIRAWLRKHDYTRSFIDYSWTLAEQMSGPSIMFKANLRDGRTIIVDDYREAYWWLRDNTAEDARVMAWWDYGYQITGIGERTTIADGNTWNHEHIATLGKALTSNQVKAHKIVRHLADYILIWAGGGGDDLAKSPHMARIGNSVYRDICPNDPTCSKFGFYSRGNPTPMMRDSLLYNLHSHRRVQGVEANPKLYKEVFSSKYGKVRIFKVLGVSEESKRWVADPSNRVCDAPGSWYCVGQYPPALKRLIDSRKPFSQLEDFNRGGADEAYVFIDVGA
jgi:dolichyl-diphosphooligosaccharide---protein glycosyltransferase